MKTRRKSLLKLKWIAVSVGVLLSGCGARLPKVASLHRPQALETPIDLSQINLLRLEDQQSVNIAEYMKTQNLQWLVLTFGSKGCGVCMEKARYFQANLVNNYSILGESKKNQVELIGISTDPVKDREEVLYLTSHGDKLSHLKWSDPGHQVMMKYFQPKELGPSVPLTVMLNRKGMLWRIASNEHVSPAEIIRKIAANIGSDVTPDLPDHTKPPVTPAIDRPLLAMEKASRLNEVIVKSCVDRKDVSLASVLPVVEKGLRGILVHKENCENSEACKEARSKMLAWRSECKDRTDRVCSFKELIIGGTLCGDDDLYAGGQEFFDIFSDHFNWGYAPYKPSATAPYKLPDSKGPLAFIFDEQGRLVYSREGAIGDSLKSQMDENGLSHRVIGPNFPVEINFKPGQVGGQNVAEKFSSVRQRSRYTLVTFWNTWCGSCKDELKETHEDKASAFHFCEAHPDFCQAISVETGRDESEMTPDEYLTSLITGSSDFEGWIRQNWSIPLAVEDVGPSQGPAAKGWFWWVKARFENSEPRIVLYDVEGKIVSSWRSLPGEHGPREMLKKYFESEH